MPHGRYSRHRARHEIPSHILLLERAAARVDDGMLGEIAEADYGMDRDAYLDGLRVLRDELVLRPPDRETSWDHEVLELVRWSRPDHEGWKPGGIGERGHWMRLFCCVALVLRDVDMPQFNHVGAINDHLAPMLVSIAVLDPALADVAIPLVQWAIEHVADPTDRAFLVLAALLLECQRAQPDWKRVLARAHELPRRIEAAWIDLSDAVSETNGWLFGLTHFDLSHDLWLPLIAKRLLTPAPDAPALVRAELEAVGVRLLPTTAARARRFGLPEPLVARYYV